MERAILTKKDLVKIMDCGIDSIKEIVPDIDTKIKADYEISGLKEDMSFWEFAVRFICDLVFDIFYKSEGELEKDVTSVPVCKCLAGHFDLRTQERIIELLFGRR